MTKCCFVTWLELTESCHQASSGLLHLWCYYCYYYYALFSDEEHDAHYQNSQWCTRKKNTFFLLATRKLLPEHLDLIRSHNWNIHNFSGLEIKFLHCISLRFHTVDDIKHKADTSNCARQDCAHQYTYRNEGNRRLDPYSLILFHLLLG